MHTKNLLCAASLFTAMAIASPTPADIESLRRRDPPPASVNQPITDGEWAALNSGGLNKRIAEADSSNDLEARDSVMNCGHTVTGKGGSNGHGKWVPVSQFEGAAHTFCNAYVGTDIFMNHETSDAYPVKFSNGNYGYVVFAIYNTAFAKEYPVDATTCYNAMVAPLGSHAKRGLDNPLAKRDNCWGSNHNDYEGGYYKVDSIGSFGSEMYPD